MTIIIDNQREGIECKNIEITLGDVYYKISINKFDELVLNKQQFGEGESSIIIKPIVSNEIRIL